jgi:hypothetical protein
VKHEHRQTILEVVAKRTLPGLDWNLHATQLAGLFGQISAHRRQGLSERAVAGDYKAGRLFVIQANPVPDDR